MLAAIDTDSKRDLLRLVVEDEPSVVVAGHYSLADDMSDVSNEGKAEAMSFELGAGLAAGAIHHGRICQLVLMINDIGVQTDQRHQFKDGYELPANYRRILTSAGLDEAQLKIMFESTMRNKASTSLRKIYKRRPQLFDRVAPGEAGLVRCVNRTACEAEHGAGGTAYVVPGPSGERLVVKEGSNPKCNLIMATFFHDIVKMYQPKQIVNIFNELYTYRLSLGIHVSQLIYDNNTPFTNVFCDGQHVQIDATGNAPRKEGRMS